MVEGRPNGVRASPTCPTSHGHPSIPPAPAQGVLRCFHSEATEGFAAEASWDPLNGTVLTRKSDRHR